MKKLAVLLLVSATLALAFAGWLTLRAPPSPTTAPTALSTAPARPTTPASSRVAAFEESRSPVSITRTPTPRPEYAKLVGREGYWRLGLTPPPGSGGGGEGGEGVWWLVSPTGKREFLNTVTTVQPFQLARDPNGPHFVSRDYNGGITESGDLNAWASKTLARIQDAGFKGLGAWCNPVFHNFPVPLTRDLNLWKWVDGDHNRVRLYDPDFARLVEVAVQKQVIPLRENRNLVGYYTDNELDWGDSLLGPRIYFDNLPPDNPNRARLTAVIKSLWPTPADFNAAWHTDLKSWADLDALPALPLSFGQTPSGSAGREGNYDAYVRLLTVWLEHAARDYFRLTTSLVRQYDPNHLILGVRFKGWAPPEVVRASRGLTDAQSLNTYVGDARLDRDMYLMMHRDSGGQPIIITEYSFHALDGRSGNRNTVGFAGQVLDQRARADGYRLKTTRLARVPFIVGADWFQWADEPPSGRHFDGEDVNFGIVDIDDRPYDHMLAAVRKTTPLLNPLHAASADEDPQADPASDVWRDSYAVRPVARIPYLTTPPTINGELSDWPASARIAGVRASRTLGLERSRVPLPNVYAGWRDDGLYLAFEVFDDDIQGTDPKGWWWTRDCLEWWIATRPIPDTQNFYDASCHQFFFVPHEFPRDGVSGTVGRWHRPGDAIPDSLVPDPNIKQSARVLPGRYVVEMRIPPEALTGFDPSRQPRLAFNLHARNWQHATDYFWSAPKESQTQLRPNTWGTLYLTPRESSDSR